MTLLDQQPGKEITDVIPTKYLPDRFRTQQDGEFLLQSFIEKTVDYLIADSLFSRDCAKEALGQELHPRLYAMLFRRLNLCGFHVFNVRFSADQSIFQRC